MSELKTIVVDKGTYSAFKWTAIIMLVWFVASIFGLGVQCTMITAKDNSAEKIITLYEESQKKLQDMVLKSMDTIQTSNNAMTNIGAAYLDQRMQMVQDKTDMDEFFRVISEDMREVHGMPSVPLVQEQECDK